MTNPQTEPWGGYIPEINAGRYESGTGPGTWMSAAASWEMYAAMVAEATLILFAQMAAAGMNWTGLATAAREAAMAPFVGWLAEMESMALANSLSCMGVATAFEAGNGTMIPLPVVNANRVSEAIAEATNFLGCNEPIIQYLNAEYARFWGENASTMTTYDGAIQAATTLRPVPSPPPLANMGAAAGDDAAGLAEAAAQSGAVQEGIQGATSAVEQGAGQGAGSGSEFMSAAQAAMGPAQSAASSLQQIPSQFMQQGQALLSPIQSLLGSASGGSGSASEAAEAFAGESGNLLGDFGADAGGFGGGGGGGFGGIGMAGALGGGLLGPNAPYGTSGNVKLASSEKSIFSGVDLKSGTTATSLGPGGMSGGGGLGAPGGFGAGSGGGSSKSPREVHKAEAVMKQGDYGDDDDMFSSDDDGPSFDE